MKIALWISGAGILAAGAVTVLMTTLTAITLAFQNGPNLSNMVARAEHGHTGVVPTQPGNPPGQATLNPQPMRVKVNPKKCYNACMKGGGGTWSDVQFCAYSCL